MNPRQSRNARRAGRHWISLVDRDRARPVGDARSLSGGSGAELKPGLMRQGLTSGQSRLRLQRHARPGLRRRRRERPRRGDGLRPHRHLGLPRALPRPVADDRRRRRAHVPRPRRHLGHEPADAPSLVQAAAAATVDDVAPERVYVGIGAGGTGVWHLGLATARQAELEAYTVALRELLARGERRTADRRSSCPGPARGRCP